MVNVDAVETTISPRLHSSAELPSRAPVERRAKEVGGRLGEEVVGVHDRIDEWYSSISWKVSSLDHEHNRMFSPGLLRRFAKLVCLVDNPRLLWYRVRYAMLALG